jgi:ketosteroid isomerase-like protein
MRPMEVVERWDAALRAGDWAAARELLTDDATYHAPEAPEEYRIDCESPDEIVDLMASFKGKASDVEVVQWSEQGDHVVARLRQPDWGDPEADWYQVLTVRGDRVARMVDYASESSARAAIAVA